jgi:hypothetical protein
MAASSAPSAGQHLARALVTRQRDKQIPDSCIGAHVLTRPGGCAHDQPSDVRALATTKASPSDGSGRSWTGQYLQHDVADLRRVDTERTQSIHPFTLVDARQRQQDVFGSDVVVAETHRLLAGALKCRLNPRREWNPSRFRHPLTRADAQRDLPPGALERDVDRLQRPRGHALFFMEQSEQQGLSADVAEPEIPRLELCKHDNLARPFREPLTRVDSIAPTCQCRESRTNSKASAVPAAPRSCPGT